MYLCTVCIAQEAGFSPFLFPGFISFLDPSGEKRAQSFLTVYVHEPTSYAYPIDEYSANELMYTGRGERFVSASKTGWRKHNGNETSLKKY